MTERLGVENGEPALLSPAGLVLMCIMENPQGTIRQMSERSGLTERAVHRNVVRLESFQLVKRVKFGKYNHYSVREDIVKELLQKQIAPFGFAKV